MVFSTEWQSINFSSLKIETWDEEFTVFQPASGKTHFLNQMSLQIILLLNCQSASTKEISHYLAKRFGQTPDRTFTRNIEKILQHFDTLGLIRKTK